MPKKFNTVNTKAAEAKQKKEERRKDEQNRKEKEVEDKLWEDNDKHVNRKLQRRDDRDKKKQEQMERKKELAQLAELELTEGGGKKQKAKPVKMSREQVEANVEAIRRQGAAAAAAVEESKGGAIVDVDLQPIEENLNRVVLDGDVAETVDDAIRVLNHGGVEKDMHPEKRMRAAYTAFEETRLPILKAEHPNLRLSQLKQLLRKEWMKSPDNPVNRSIEGR